MKARTRIMMQIEKVDKLLITSALTKRQKAVFRFGPSDIIAYPIILNRFEKP